MRKSINANQIINDTVIPWETLKNAVILITGATGLVGGALAGALSAVSNARGLSLHIIGHGRSREKGEVIQKKHGIDFIYGDIRQPHWLKSLPERVDYIFHCAAITASAQMVSEPVQVMTTAVDGTVGILALAKEKNVKSLVYLSSMEIYGQMTQTEVCEIDLGYLDLSNPRSSYPESKRYCEMLCTAYASQYGTPVKIARLAQTFGAGTPMDDTRVFAQFARAGVAGQNIVLHTTGQSRGNYCDISDAVRGLILLLVKGKNGEAYNIVNPQAGKTIREMAEMVAVEIFGGAVKVVVDIPPDINKRGYAPSSNFTLNADKLSALGWKPTYGLAEMYKNMINEWQGYNV
ncbi:MAG: NAD(P)-dependent oxidoreductase [Defluviitaleaceae bacterium]|nr:NAD(P)-dependent oxidoreductase [Defluviitaleaceae bacterium]MCL2273911.1 NAD(P)-dependent oxidoreductase [Defluviitaleaceae bacterium]